MDSSNRISAIIPQRKCDANNTKFNTRNEMNMHAQFFSSRKKPAFSNTNIMIRKSAKKITCLFCLVSGLGFHFEINDLPIFLKGANWIPAGISVFHQLKFSSWD